MANNNVIFTADSLKNCATFPVFQAESRTLSSIGSDVNRALADARLALTSCCVDGGAEALTIISVKKDKKVVFDMSKLTCEGESLTAEVVAQLLADPDWKSAKADLEGFVALWNAQRKNTEAAKNACYKFLPDTKALVNAYADFQESLDRSGLDEVWTTFLTNLGVQNVKSSSIKKFLDRIMGTTHTGNKSVNKDGENVWKGEAELKAGDEFKVRADGAWDNSWGVDGFNGANLTCEADGTYVVTITFDADGNGTVEAVAK